MADNQRLRVFAFCWNTQSLLIGKFPDGQEATLTQEEIQSMANSAGVEGQVPPPEEGGSYYSMSGMWNAISSTVSSAMEYGSQNYSAVSNFVWTSFKAIYGEPIIADFLGPLIKKIKEKNPDIIVVTLVESAKPGDYLISHIIPGFFLEHGYDLQIRWRAMGFGKTTATKGVERGLRIGIFTRKDLDFGDGVSNEKMALAKYFSSNSYSCDTQRGKGGVSITMNHPTFGNVSFIVLHMPHNAKSIIDYRDNDSPHYLDDIKRNEALKSIDSCFNAITRQLVFNQQKPLDGVIMMGDFNYRIRTASALQFTKYMMSDRFNPRKIYLEHDELYKQTRTSMVYPFAEGVEKQGPSFRPTCKMSQGRYQQYCQDTIIPIEMPLAPGAPKKNSIENLKERGKTMRANKEFKNYEECWNLGKEDQRTPSWCDRIIYQTYAVDKHTKINIVCIEYDRFDQGNSMAMSDHAGVYGVFDIIPLF